MSAATNLSVRVIGASPVKSKTDPFISYTETRSRSLRYLAAVNQLNRQLIAQAAQRTWQYLRSSTQVWDSVCRAKALHASDIF
jgi:hypothetical protein